MRRALALSALGLAALAPVAHAAPSAGPESGSAVQFRLTTHAGVYTVSVLESTAAGGGTAMLRLRLASGSGKAARYAGALPATALSTTGSVTTLTTRLGSEPLRIVFRPQTPVVTVSFGNVDSDEGLAEGWAIAGNGGTAQVSLGGVRCTVTLMATGTATVVDAGSYGQPLARGLGVPLRGARCDDVPDDPFPPV